MILAPSRWPVRWRGAFSVRLPSAAASCTWRRLLTFIEIQTVMSQADLSVNILHQKCFSFLLLASRFHTHIHTHLHPRVFPLFFPSSPCSLSNCVVLRVWPVSLQCRGEKCIRSTWRIKRSVSRKHEKLWLPVFDVFEPTALQRTFTCNSNYTESVWSK